MGKQILIINGHPDASTRHFGAALIEAYRNAAEAAGHRCTLLELSAQEFTLIHSREEWEAPAGSPAILEAQRLIHEAEHLLLVYPLWLGTMPALLKGFLEQVLRPGFAIRTNANGTFKRLLKHKSVRIVVTMGMPALVYRWFFGAHSLKNLQRNILSFVGFGPVRSTLVGMVEGSQGHRQRALARMGKLGAKAV